MSNHDQCLFQPMNRVTRRIQVSDKPETALTGHLFYFDKTFVYKKVEEEKSLGSELDLTLKYNASNVLDLQAGYSMYFNSSSTKKYFKMDQVDTHTQQWAYMMLTVRPQFYKTPAPLQ